MSRLKSLFMVAANLAAMVAANFRGDLKISDQNNWGDLSKKLNFFWEGAKFKGKSKILGGAYEHSW